MTKERVIVTVKEGIAHVQLNRPEKRNALDLEMFRALIAASDNLAKQNEVRVVVLSGVGSVFCAGMDFMSIFGGGDATMTELLKRRGLTNAAQQAAWGWFELPVPVIAAVQGAAFGGGLQIALAADMRFITKDTKLSVMETTYGLIPDMSITQTLLRLVPSDVARELVYTAKVITGPEAVSLGLATRVCKDPLAEAMKTAKLIAKRAPNALRAAKRLLNEAPNMSTKEALLLETTLQIPLLGSPEQQEAVMAAMMKRTPLFNDPK